MVDNKRRTIIKALTWKLTGIISLLVLTYLLTGSLHTASLLAFLQFVVTFVLYIIHEKLWTSISWGKARGISIQMTGMSGSGKSTLSKLVSQRLIKKGYKVEVIDGDEYRENLCKDLGFSKEDRNTNIRRLSFVSKVLSRNNVISIIAAINPYDSIRKENKEKDPSLRTVFIKCDLDTLIERDVKGLYAKALLPTGHPERIENFTGISDPFEAPNNPDLIVNTAEQTLEESAKILEEFIIKEIS